jgi:hypothetical protein
LKTIILAVTSPGNAAWDYLLIPKEVSKQHEQERNQRMSEEQLAEQLLAVGADTQSLSQVYRFLLRYHEASIAKEEFVRFLRGERCELLLSTAKACVDPSHGSGEDSVVSRSKQSTSIGAS